MYFQPDGQKKKKKNSRYNYDYIIIIIIIHYSSTVGVRIRNKTFDSHLVTGSETTRSGRGDAASGI